MKKLYFYSNYPNKFLTTNGQTFLKIQPHIDQMSKPVINRLFPTYVISILSKRALNHVLKNKKYFYISEIKPYINFGGKIVIVGFQSQTGLHIAYWRNENNLRYKLNLNIDGFKKQYDYTWTEI